MDIENNPPSLPPGNEVPAPNNPPPQVPPVVETPPTVQTNNAPPPATALVVQGEVKSPRELQLERELREAQTRAAEFERDLQTLTTPTPQAAPVVGEVKPKKVKRKFLLPTVLDNDEGGEDE